MVGDAVLAGESARSAGTWEMHPPLALEKLRPPSACISPPEKWG